MKTLRNANPPRRHAFFGDEIRLVSSAGTLWAREPARSASPRCDQGGQVLKGAEPSELPVEQPTSFELAINIKTARTLGVTLPASLLARAGDVTE
jgi:hypothetical protein